MKKNRPLFLLLFLFLFMVQKTSAEEVMKDLDQLNKPQADQAWTENIVNLKESMKAILQKNDSLLSENELLRQKIIELKNDLNKLGGVKEELSKEPVNLEGALKTKTQEVDRLKAELANLKDKIVALKSDNEKIQQQMAKHESGRKTASGEVKNLLGQIEKFKKDIGEAKVSKQGLLKDFEVEKKRLNQLIVEAQAKQTKAEAELAKTKKRSDDPQKNLNALTQDQQKIVNELVQVKENLAQSIKEKQGLQEENIRLKSLIKDKGPSAFTQEIENLKKQNEKLKNEINQLQKDSSHKKTLSATFSDREKDLEKQISLLEKESASLKEQVVALTDNAVRLNRDKAMAESLLEEQTSVQEKKNRSKTSAQTARQKNHELLGYQYAANGQNEKAIEEYKLAQQANPNKKDIYFNLGFIYSKLQKNDEAVASYKRVLELDPNDKEANYNLSQIYKKLSNLEESKRYHNRYLELNKK